MRPQPVTDEHHDRKEGVGFHSLSNNRKCERLIMDQSGNAEAD